MKILHTVEFYHPAVGGMQEVVKQLSERLVKTGHDVTVATTKLPTRNAGIINGVKIVEFDISGNFVRGLTGEVERYKNYLLNSDFDVITNFAAQQWATDIMLLNLDQIKAKKVNVPTGFSGLYLPEYQEYFAQMKTWLKQYDACVYLSNNYRDINYARKFGVNNNVLIPNGAGADEFGQKSSINIRSELNIPMDHFLILHVGSHTGLKGHKEAIRIFKKAHIKNATFLMVANNFGNGCGMSCLFAEKLNLLSPRSKLLDKKIIVKSLSRKETVAAYHEADLFLFPSNIECSPLVLFEAMASKTPFLTTDVGNAKEIIDWSNGGKLLPSFNLVNGYIRADVEASTDIFQKLYYDTEERKRLANNGYKKWKSSFTWEKIAKQYEDLYIDLLNDKREVNL